jgi:ParB family chromosome partitioning protein
LREKPKLDLGLTAYDDLFKNDTELAESRLPKIYDIPIELIDDFPDHPFKVKMDEDMDQLVESIKERGLITPITLRPKEDGRYEVVSGHRRKKACEIAGLSYVKADVREMSRDEAIILMVESNLQRSVILPSEKAFSYKMRLEAMNRLPGRPSGNLTPVVSEKMRTNEELGKEVGESREQIRRYIRLTELIPDLLDLVDEGKIALRPAVELSYLSKDEQVWSTSRLKSANALHRTLRP